MARVGPALLTMVTDQGVQVTKRKIRATAHRLFSFCHSQFVDNVHRRNTTSNCHNVHMRHSVLRLGLQCARLWISTDSEFFLEI